MRPANESEEEAGRLFGLDEVLLQQSNRNAPPMWNNSGNANPVPIQSQSRSTNLLDANTGALMSNLTTLQHKARVLETFIQNNYAQFEGGYQQQAAVSVMSTILYDLISTGASVLQSVQGNQVPVVTTPATETKDIVQPQQQHSEDEEEDDVCVGVEEYEVVEMNEDDILVEHTHFCEICGKGFRRDANVRMHMRAHGNEYKTPEALMSNKDKEKGKDANNQDESRQRRYSCPFDKCRRNRNHRKFKPLKSIQSLRNHYKRSHCPKMYTCNKCNKHFSVVGDLKTHGKTCGHNRWRCSCGTTFTRKDKLFGHVSLFEGHRPLLPIDDINNHNASSSVSASASRKRKTPSSAMPTPTTQLMSASTATSQSGVNAISVPDYFVDCFAAEKAVPVPVPVVASQQHKNNSIDGFHTTGFYDPEFWADFPAEFADK